MMKQFEPIKNSILHQIPFFDVDPMNITWHGHYVKYFELARCALLDKIGFNYQAMAASDYYWPIVDLQVKYIKSAYFSDEIIITATLIEFENRLRIEYFITNKKTGDKLTKGHTTQVAVSKHDNEICFVSPQILIDKIKEYYS